MELGFADTVILALAAAAAIWGAVKGISGQLASVAWLAAAVTVAALVWSPAREAALARGFGAWAGGAAAILLALVAAAVVWALVRKCVSALVPQPFNAIFGALAALLKLLAALAVLAWTGWLAGRSIALDAVSAVAGFGDGPPSGEAR